MNTSKAVSYSTDLHLSRPDNIKPFAQPKVQDVHQLKGSNVTILTFPFPEPPKSIELHGTTFQLEQYWERPRLCGRCFSFMHKTTVCHEEPRCGKCSQPKNNHLEEECDSYCCNCKQTHSPKLKTCPEYKFEEALRRGCGRDTSVLIGKGTTK